MGRSVIEILLADEEASIVAAVDRAGQASLGQDAGVLVGAAKPIGIVVSDDLRGAIERCQVVIDFSTPEASIGVIARCGGQAWSASGRCSRCCWSLSSGGRCRA
jgi:4-hydroxy-tetrahydrodipicolinate reductase